MRTKRVKGTKKITKRTQIKKRTKRTQIKRRTKRTQIKRRTKRNIRRGGTSSGYVRGVVTAGKALDDGRRAMKANREKNEEAAAAKAAEDLRIENEEHGKIFELAKKRQAAYEELRRRGAPTYSGNIRAGDLVARLDALVVDEAAAKQVAPTLVISDWIDKEVIFYAGDGSKPKTFTALGKYFKDLLIKQAKGDVIMSEFTVPIEDLVDAIATAEYLDPREDPPKLVSVKDIFKKRLYTRLIIEIGYGPPADKNLYYDKLVSGDNTFVYK